MAEQTAPVPTLTDEPKAHFCAPKGWLRLADLFSRPERPLIAEWELWAINHHGRVTVPIVGMDNNFCVLKAEIIDPLGHLSSINSVHVKPPMGYQANRLV